MRAYFDDNNNLIGLNDENNPLSEKFKELNEEEYQAIISGVNKEIRISEEGTLLFIEKAPDMPQELEELKKLEEVNKQATALEEQKQKMTLTTIEMHEQALVEIMQNITLKGDEIMVITIIVGRIVAGLMQFKNVPEPIKPKVKEELTKLGLEFLAE